MHSVNWLYAVLMGAALLTCSLLLRRTQHALPLSATEKLSLGLGAFIGAMLGAKLPFLLARWDELLTSGPWLSDGKTIMCGIVGGYAGVECAKWALGIRIKTGDSFAVPVALAVGVGRLACFQAGCCYGTPTDLPWGVCFSTADADDAIARHPTQIYEAMFHFGMAITLLLITVAFQRNLRSLAASHNSGSAIALPRWQTWLQGHLIKMYILSYLVYRFGSEFLRPETRIWLGLTGYQWAAIVLFFVFAGLWVYELSSQKNSK